ncbi:MAG: sulfotransferase family protein [Candidatus Heimdallarchaeaceae archaeon]
MGASFVKWIKLLYQNKFRVSFRYFPRAFAITLVTFLFSPFVILEQMLYNRRIKKTEVTKPPIFIIGHWRGGTTYLQNLMLNDDRFTYLNLVEATFPHQFLTSYRFIKAAMSPLIPEKRPMDNMQMRAETPQEHEFALTSYCLLSPLVALFFPKNKEKYLRYTSFEEANEKERKQWKKAFMYLMKKLTIKGKGKQLLLKNPLDTYRMKLILEMFPNAKFIHIYRNPYEVFFSTVKLYKTNTAIFFLQKLDFDIEEFIFNMYKGMYTQFYKDLEDIPKESIIEIRYEDLCTNPHAELEKIYSQLKIGEYSKVKDKISKYLETLKGYKVGKYEIKDEDELRIYQQWHEMIDKWGYKVKNEKELEKF